MFYGTLFPTMVANTVIGQVKIWPQVIVIEALKLHGRPVRTPQPTGRSGDLDIPFVSFLVFVQFVSVLTQ